MNGQPEFSAMPSLCVTNPRDVDLQMILSAWNEATERLQSTHQALRKEVKRLSDELEIKNRELARKNRLADLGQMASHVAHEVRNNLMPMTLYLSLLKRRISADSGSIDVLGKVENGLKSLDSTVNDLLHFAADRDPRRQTFDLAQLVHEVCDSLAPQFDAQGIATHIDSPARVMMSADRDMLRRAIMNLIINALDAMPDGGDLVITAMQSQYGIELEIADSGPGLPDDVRRRVFEPFFTTKHNGTGLGLAIVYRTVETHGGFVTAANCPEGGAAFTLKFPRLAAMEAAA